MFIISKKKIVFIVSCFIILTFLISIAYIRHKKTYETVALPEKNKTIVLDAGHGMPDGGATEKRSNRGRY